MEDVELYQNLIIFSDFSVFSSYSKETTLTYLRNSIAFLSSYEGIFSICFSQRILVSVIEGKKAILTSPLPLKDTIDFLEGVIILLEWDETNFFCPDSF